MKNKIIKTMLLSVVVASTMYANDVSMQNQPDIEKQYIQSVIPGTKFSKYEKARELDGFYKLFMDNGQIMYINPMKELIVFGEVWTTKGQSITQNDAMRWQQELQEKQIEGLNPTELTENALKLEFGKGSARYEFVVFTDPECPYCKKAEDVMIKKDVTVYINYMPLDFHKNAREWSLDILSSASPKQALADIKSGKEVKVNHTKKSKDQLSKMEALAKKLNVTGTPKLFVIDKKDSKIVDVINGANIPQIEKYLAK